MRLVPRALIVIALAVPAAAAAGQPALAARPAGLGTGGPTPPPASVAVSQTMFADAVGCDPTDGICLAGAVLPGANAYTPGAAAVVPVTYDGPGAAVGTGGIYVHGVDCLSDTSCVVVGETNDYTIGATSEADYEVLTISGGVLQVGEPEPIAQSYLSDVTCVTNTECVALGALGTTSYLVQFDPATDSATYTPASAFSSLDALACPSATDCVIGGGDPSAPADSLVSTFDPATSVFGATHKVTGFVMSASCATSTTCEAVSEVTGPAGAVLPVRAATGIPGKETIIPGGGTGATDGGGAYYNTISCAAFNGCLVAGGVNTELSSYTSATQSVVVTVDNGVVGTPSTLTPAETSDEILAVTCPLANACLGVGSTAETGGPGGSTNGMAVTMDAAGTPSDFPFPNVPNGTPCPPTGVADGPVPTGSNFESVTDKSKSALLGVQATIGAAADCYDQTDTSLYPSSWVMLQGGKTFVQGGIAYHQHGGPDRPFVELSPNLWTPSNADWNPPASAGITVGSSLEFPHWNGTDHGTFDVIDQGVQTSQQWCSWVPQDVRSHSELEGSPPGLFSSADELEVEMNGSCLWIFYLPASHAALHWANAATETHTAWEHMPGTATSPLVFSDMSVYTTTWQNFTSTGTGSLPQTYLCDADAGYPSGTGTGYTFSTWGTMAPDDQLNPTCLDEH